MTDEPISHIARSPLPWRAATDNDTECGKPVAEFAHVITWDEAIALVVKHGRQRAAFLLCMTCTSTSQRWMMRNDGTRSEGQCTFEDMPTERLSREFGKRREQTDRELRAMGELVTRYRDEFDALMDGSVVPIAELRRKQQRETQRRGDR